MAGIPSSQLVKYPEELTNKWWQKKKGVGGKMTPTGLGEVLEKTESQHKKVDWAAVDPRSSSPKTQEQLDKAVKACRDYYDKHVAPMEKQFKTVEAAAKKAADILAKTKLGKKAGKEATAIAKVANNWALMCKSIEFDAYIKEVEEKIDKLNKLARGNLDGSLKKWLVGQKAYLASDQTKVDWDNLLKQHGRSVSNCVKQDSAYNEKFWKDFQKFKGFDLGALKLSGDDQETKDKRAQVVKAANDQVKQIAAFKP